MRRRGETGQARLTLADVSAFTGRLCVSRPWIFVQLAALGRARAYTV
jgi:hypothetical protein